MARAPRLALAGVPVHVVQRGNNRGTCFACDDDFRRYLSCLRRAIERYACSVHAYVLMTNHVHLLVTPQESHAVSGLMQHLGRRYVRTFNKIHGRTGTLWEGRFRSSVIDSERYFLVCQRYIENNPVRAGMTTSALDYPWSSYRHYTGAHRDPLVTEHECYLRLGRTPSECRQAYGELFADGIPHQDLESIRFCLNKGRPLGSDEFRARVNADVLTTQRRGRDPRIAHSGITARRSHAPQVQR